MFWSCSGVRSSGPNWQTARAHLGNENYEKKLCIYVTIMLKSTTQLAKVIIMYIDLISPIFSCSRLFNQRKIILKVVINQTKVVESGF